MVGRQIVFCEKHEDRVYCYGYDGTELWNREVKGYAQTLVGAGSEGLDLILFESPAGAFPYVLNGWGEEAFAFDGAKDYEIPPFEGRQRGDWGFNLKAELCDLDADGQDEILVHNREQMWMYKVPEAP